MICASSGTTSVKSTCSGDSGGPVITNEFASPVHVAIISFVGDSGCESDNIFGFTRTAYYRNWIKSSTGV
ncbi:hypothetical protein MTP99_002006 [Tenebrio molitor]|nr:hypothetical protein MTP99_002006 [Tenebrio molitor]